jgi:hypothetical protein
MISGRKDTPPRYYEYEDGREYTQGYYRLEVIRYKGYVVWITYDIFKQGEVSSDGTKEGAYGFRLYRRGEFVGESATFLGSYLAAALHAELVVNMRVAHGQEPRRQVQ